jgi:hypothetical protein
LAVNILPLYNMKSAVCALPFFILKSNASKQKMAFIIFVYKAILITMA